MRAPFAALFAILVLSSPVSADVKPADTKTMLDQLYTRLAAAGSDEEAQGIVSAIERVQLQSGSDTTDLLMVRALSAIQAKKLNLSITVLTSVINLDPDFTEAWNKRATVYFLQNDYVRSMADIAQTLQRDPRHIGAWSGLGMILQQSGDKKRAYAAYKHALTIDPHMPAIRKAVDALRDEVEGRPI